MQKKSEPLTRLVGGSALLLLGTALIFFSHSPYIKPLFILAVLAFVSGALAELYEIAKAKGYRPLAPLAIFFSSLILLSLSFQSDIELPLLLFYALMALSFGHYLSKGDRPLLNLAVTLFGIGYLTFPLSHILLINYGPHEEGATWLLFALLVTKSADIAAYYAGTLFGKHPLAPFVSPKKSIEGAVAGVLGSVGVGLLFTSYFPIMTLVESLALSLAIGIMAQFGDLSESLLKRDAHVKDSNRIPGLGGLLDMCDSLVFTLPIVYFAVKYL